MWHWGGYDDPVVTTMRLGAGGSGGGPCRAGPGGGGPGGGQGGAGTGRAGPGTARPGGVSYRRKVPERIAMMPPTAGPLGPVDRRALDAADRGW